MRVPVFEDGKDEPEEEKTEEEENEEDKVNRKAPPSMVFVPVMAEVKTGPFSSFPKQGFFKPVIEDLRMELARKCTEFISDVSGLGDFIFFSVSCVEQ